MVHKRGILVGVCKVEVHAQSGTEHLSFGSREFQELRLYEVTRTFVGAVPSVAQNELLPNCADGHESPAIYEDSGGSELIYLGEELRVIGGGIEGESGAYKRKVKRRSKHDEV